MRLVKSALTRKFQIQTHAPHLNSTRQILAASNVTHAQLEVLVPLPPPQLNVQLVNLALLELEFVQLRLLELSLLTSTYHRLAQQVPTRI